MKAHYHDKKHPELWGIYEVIRIYPKKKLAHLEKVNGWINGYFDSITFLNDEEEYKQAMEILK